MSMLERNKDLYASIRAQLEKEVYDSLAARYGWALHTEPVTRAINMGALRITELQGKINSDTFWSTMVYPEGFTAEQVRGELADFHFMMEQVSEIYMALTGGKLSKQMYYAGTILSLMEDRIADLIVEGVKEHLELEHIEAAEHVGVVEGHTFTGSTETRAQV